MIYLIDFENVHEEGFSALGRLGDKDAVYCFFTRNVAKISMSALAGMRSGQLHFIEAESGKQSLDLALVSFLGYLIGTRPQELYYDIVSNDNGFAKVAEFWNRRGSGLRVRIRKTTDMKPRVEPVKAQPQTTVNPQRRAQSQNPVTEQPAGTGARGDGRACRKNRTGFCRSRRTEAGERKNRSEQNQRPSAHPAPARRQAGAADDRLRGRSCRTDCGNGTGDGSGARCGNGPGSGDTRSGREAKRRETSGTGTGREEGGKERRGEICAQTGGGQVFRVRQAESRGKTA